MLCHYRKIKAKREHEDSDKNLNFNCVNSSVSEKIPKEGMLEPQIKNGCGRRHPKQNCWSQFKCNLREICRKDHSEREHQGTAGSQAWALDWKAERSQRRGRVNQIKEFRAGFEEFTVDLKRGFQDVRGRRVWWGSWLQKWHMDWWGEGKRHTNTCPPASLTCSWTSLPKLPIFKSLSSQASLFPWPLLNTWGRVWTPSQKSWL